jgi:ABC-type transport system substrate-binding protein
MKLRQGAGWAPLPPVNGRPVNIDDIAYTWKRWIERGSNRGDYLNSLDPDSPVLSMTTTDPRTFVFKLAFPMVGLLGMMASNIKQSYILPAEAESKYDIRNTPIGSGPFYVSQYSGSIGWTLKRNPNFYDKERPYLDEIQRPIVPEYANALAQFRTGNILDMTNNVTKIRAEDILPTKRDLPALNMYQLEPDGSVRFIRFGWKPTDKSVFRDERVRQAFSMSWDRDAWLDVVGNISKYRQEGLPVDSKWSTSVEPNYAGWWLDPQTKEFGENAKYFKRDLTEAKKLLSAAGYANGVDTASIWPPTGYGNDLSKDVEILSGMAREAGFKFSAQQVDFNTEWPKFRDGRGNFEGLAWQNWGVSGTDPGERLWKEVSSGASNLLFTGFDTNGKGDFSGDSTLETMLRNARREVDLNKRRTIVQDAQRYMAKKMYNIRFPGQVGGFRLSWPALRNDRVFQGGQMEYYNVWIDESQAPIKKT